MRPLDTGVVLATLAGCVAVSCLGSGPCRRDTPQIVAVPEGVYVIEYPVSKTLNGRGHFFDPSFPHGPLDVVTRDAGADIASSPGADAGAAVETAPGRLTVNRSNDLVTREYVDAAGHHVREVWRIREAPDR